MDKLKMAHDWAMKYGSPENFKLTVDEAWEYADAMQAEADKRALEPDVGNTDVRDFQIDWSQAPKWAKWRAFDGCSKKANWYANQPYIDDGSMDEDDWNVKIRIGKVTFSEAPNFNYQGAWQDSLRKRPNT